MIEKIDAKEQLDFLWDHAQVGLAYVGNDGSWLKVNPYICNLLGYTEYELTKMKFADVTHPADLLADEESVKEVLSGEREGYIMDKRYIPKIGSPIWIRLHVSAIKDEEDKFICFLSQVTERLFKCHDCPSVTGRPRPSPKEEGNVIKFIKKNWKVWVTIAGVIVSVIAALLGLPIPAG